MRTLRKVESKAQVLNAIFASLLGTVRTQFTFGEALDLSIYLVKRQWVTLQVLAQYQEAERILERAVTICTSLHGARHVLTLRLLDQLACLGFERQNYSRAKLLFERLLCDSRNEDGRVIEPLIRGEALTALAHLAKVDGDLPKAEALTSRGAGLLSETLGSQRREHNLCDEHTRTDATGVRKRVRSRSSGRLFPPRR
jgi:hypothetical protein